VRLEEEHLRTASDLPVVDLAGTFPGQHHGVDELDVDLQRLRVLLSGYAEVVFVRNEARVLLEDELPEVVRVL